MSLLSGERLDLHGGSIACIGTQGELAQQQPGRQGADDPKHEDLAPEHAG